MTQQPKSHKASPTGFSLLISAVFGGALGGLTTLFYYPSLRPYWHLLMIGGAAAAVLAVALLDLNDRLNAARGEEDRGQLGCTLQSAFLAFLMFAIVMLVCGAIVFMHHK